MSVEKGGMTTPDGVADERIGATTHVGAVLARVHDRTRRLEEYLTDFTCPLHDGQPAPCVHAEPTGQPSLQTPHGTAPCPVQEQEQCVPHVAWLMRVRDAMVAARDRAGKRMGLPTRLRAATLEGAKPTVAIQAVRAWLRDGAPRGTCLLLMGDTGTGKSWAASAGLQAWPDDARRFLFGGEIASELMNPDGRRRMYRRVRTTPFLVWDEYAQQAVKDGSYLAAALDELVWWREAERLPTIFTTNLSPCRPQCQSVDCSDPLHFRARMSKPVLDRMRTWGTVIACTGPSLRAREGDRG